jgi:DNA-binding response OmpR family regulator
MKTILFAEDDEVLLMAYRGHLKQAGYAVTTAQDGLETLKHLSMFEPDLLILDLMMPKFDGKELLQFISNTLRLGNLPVIILSSKNIVDVEHEQLMKRADKYLIKQDCTPAILLAAIKEQLTGQFQASPAGKAGTPDDSAPSLIRASQKLTSAS